MTIWKKLVYVIILYGILIGIIFVSNDPALFGKADLPYAIDLSTLTADDIDFAMMNIQRFKEVNEADLAVYCEYANQLFMLKSISSETYFDLLRGFMDEKTFIRLNRVNNIENVQIIQNRYFKTKLSLLELHYSNPVQQNDSTAINVLRKYNGYEEYLTYYFTRDDEQKLTVSDIKRKS